MTDVYMLVHPNSFALLNHHLDRMGIKDIDGDGRFYPPMGGVRVKESSAVKEGILHIVTEEDGVIVKIREVKL